jgi:hypothetical protein
MRSSSHLRRAKPFAFIRDNDGGGPSEQDCGQMLRATNNVADGLFHHLTLVRDLGSTQMVLYVDGMAATNAPLNIGSSGAIWDAGRGNNYGP